MFSISKLATLAVIIAVIWYGFKLIGRLDNARKRKASEQEAEGGRQNRAEPRQANPRNDVVDLVRDERTGEYVTPDKRDDRA